MNRKNKEINAMDMHIDELPNKQLHKILQDLAQFMALYEQTEDRFKVRKEEMDQQIVTLKEEMQVQINEIRKALNDIKEVMTVAGAARWRVSAEKAMKQGEDHLVAIKATCNVYKKVAEESSNRLEQVSIATEKRVSSALHHLNEENSVVVEDFRRRAESSYEELETTTANAISSIRRLLRWLRFDRIATAVIAALMTAFLTSLYINAEWPWESFHKAEQERLIGKTLMAVWPTLPSDKQNQIRQVLGQNI